MGVSEGDSECGISMCVVVYLLQSPFEVVHKVFEPFKGGKELTLQEKSDLFFQDYSLASLFVQENYLKARPQHAK